MPPNPAARRAAPPSRIIYFAIALAIALTLLVAAPALLFLRPLVNRTGSMEDTIFQGEKFLVETASKAVRTPLRRDELVIIRYPIDHREIFIKRVAGIPGDRIHLANKRLFRNGTEVLEPYVVHRTDNVEAYRDNFPGYPDLKFPLPVPPLETFGMASL